jgi:hypothetical protein
MEDKVFRTMQAGVSEPQLATAAEVAQVPVAEPAIAKPLTAHTRPHVTSQHAARRCALCGGQAVVVGVAAYNVGTAAFKCCTSCDHRWFDQTHAIF